MESPNIVFIDSSVCSREDQYKNTTKRQAVESDSDVETEDQFNESIKRKAVDSDWGTRWRVSSRLWFWGTRWIVSCS